MVIAVNGRENMIPLRRVSSDDAGAIAIIAALVALVLIAFSAFAVDLGNAWANKRKLSVASDAAALAGAGAIAARMPAGVTCETALATMLARTGESATTVASEAAKETFVGQSVAAGEMTPVSVSCVNNPDGSNAAEVTSGARREVPTFFAGLLGVNSTFPSAKADARVTVLGSGLGLRPIAACTTTVNQVIADLAAKPAPTAPSGTAQPGYFLLWMAKTWGKDDANTRAVCTGDTSSSGNFGFIDLTDDGAISSSIDKCGGKGSTNANCIANLMEFGFDNIFPLPNSVPADQGLQSSMVDSFLSNLGKEIMVPAISSFDKKDTPVESAVTVKVCAIQWKTDAVKRDPSCPTFTSNDFYQERSGRWMPLDPGGDNQASYYVVKYVSRAFGTVDPTPQPGCKIGDSCDLGTRGLTLYR